MERRQGDICVPREEQRPCGCQGMDGTGGGSADDDPGSHTHHMHILASVEVDAGLNSTQDHSAVLTLIHSHRPKSQAHKRAESARLVS